MSRPPTPSPTSCVDAAPTPAGAAAAARSVLACPAGASLVVEGLDGALPGELGMHDLAGRPTFSCPPDEPLARAAAAGRQALLTLSSGLGAADDPSRDDVLHLGGGLRRQGRHRCECCDDERDVVDLEVTFVLLVRGEERLRVPPADFGSPAHELNRGFLQRTAEHATDCHQDELRAAVAGSTGRPPGQVAGVRLGELAPDGVVLTWVGPDGAHRDVLRFGATARTGAELGELLSRALPVGLL